MGEHNCGDVISLIHVYLDEEMDEGTRVHIEAHLRSCSACLEAFDFEGELRRVVAQRCREGAPDRLRQRIIDLLDDLAGHES